MGISQNCIFEISQEKTAFNIFRNGKKWNFENNFTKFDILNGILQKDIASCTSPVIHVLCFGCIITCVECVLSMCLLHMYFPYFYSCNTCVGYKHITHGFLHIIHM